MGGELSLLGELLRADKGIGDLKLNAKSLELVGDWLGVNKCL